MNNAPVQPQPSQAKYSQYAENEIDLRELFSVLWDGKWWIVGLTSIAAVIAVVYALSLPNLYRSEVLLAPASDGGGGGLGVLAANFGGLAGMAGISLPGGGGSDKTGLGLEVMKSRAFIQRFIERRNILVPLMAAEAWDASSGELVINERIYNVGTNTWVREANPPKKAGPSAQESYRAFSGLFTVSQDTGSGFVTFAIKHVSPVVAQQWVTWFIEDVNDAMRDDDVREAERSITYLKDQVEATSLADLQSMFFELIQKQTETIMLAQVRSEYLFKTIDPAIVPEQRAEPKRAIICVSGTLLGSMIAVLWVLISHYMFKLKESE
jgi:uncharacterized protein involved in exopolysaccharide biosynthesis